MRRGGGGGGERGRELRLGLRGVCEGVKEKEKQ